MGEIINSTMRSARRLNAGRRPDETRREARPRARPAAEALLRATGSGGLFGRPGVPVPMSLMKGPRWLCPADPVSLP